MELDYKNDEMEIDLKEIIILLLKKWWLIGAGAILCAGLAFVYCRLTSAAVYQSTSSMLVLNQMNEAGDDGYLSQSTKVTDDYIELISSRIVVEQAIANLNLEDEYEDVVSSISAKCPSGTRIIEITVTDADAEKAKILTDELQKVTKKYIEELFEVYAVKILDEGNISENAIKPSAKKYVVVGFGAGVVLAAMFIVIIYIMDDTIKTESQIKHYLNTRLLGSVKSSEYDVLVYETLRTNVKTTLDNLQTIVVTSSKINEDADKVAYNLATSFAENDKKVLYIDADLRKEDANDKTNLVSIASGKTLKDVCTKSDGVKFTTILAKQYAQASTLFESENFAKLLSDAKVAYDIVVINTPALNTYIDAAIVAKQCDGTIVVVKEGKINYQVVQKTMKQLAYMDAKVLGCVINK